MVLLSGLKDLIFVPESKRAGVANLSEAKSHNFSCAAAKSHMRHVGTHAQKSSVYFLLA